MFVDQFNDPATATGNASQRVFRDNDRQTGFFGYQAIQVTQQRTTASQQRPAQRLGYWPRRLIGWLAVATLGASLIVYVASLF